MTGRTVWRAGDGWASASIRVDEDGTATLFAHEHRESARIRLTQEDVAKLAALAVTA